MCAESAHARPGSAAYAELFGILRSGRFVALTGAGMSTDSGIPDYRGPVSRLRPRAPIQHADFIRSEAVRRRYWARALIGWERFVDAQPNVAHLALAKLEQAGNLRSTITQNVDRLHQAAGSERVLELHGALAEVRCLGCGALEDRRALQARLRALNPQLCDVTAFAAPDGDAELPTEAIDGTRLASCLTCDGVLKPNVVFFGDNVAKPLVEAAFAEVEAADALLVLGTSLHVFSGLRFVRRAHERNIPIVIVNQGETRGDPLAALRLDAALGDVVPALLHELTRDAAR